MADQPPRSWAVRSSARPCDSPESVPQQVLRKLSAANGSNALPSEFLAQPTQLSDTSAKLVVRAVLRRVTQFDHSGRAECILARPECVMRGRRIEAVKFLGRLRRLSEHDDQSGRPSCKLLLTGSEHFSNYLRPAVHTARHTEAVRLAGRVADADRGWIVARLVGRFHRARLRPADHFRGVHPHRGSSRSGSYGGRVLLEALAAARWPSGKLLADRQRRRAGRHVLLRVPAAGGDGRGRLVRRRAATRRCGRHPTATW